MSAPVKLPRRLPDREPVRSGEARDIARAIRCCETHGGSTPRESSSIASRRKPIPIDEHGGLVSDWTPWPEERLPLAWWLPEHLRGVPLAELRRMLAALEAEEQHA